MASILKNYDNLLPSEIEEKSLEAREWFKDNLRNIKVNRNKLLVEGTPIRRPFLGTLVLFNYDAKGYATLPYWDKYPVVIPIEPRGKGFLGLNLHYLPPRKRLELLEVFDQLAGKKLVFLELTISFALTESFFASTNHCSVKKGSIIELDLSP